MPTVLFVCTENACRSQMAEGWARRLLKDWPAYSAGSAPRGEVDARAIAVMGEVGIDISAQKSKGFADLPKREFDIAVTMGCEGGCLNVRAGKMLAWDIPDPAGKDIESYRRVRDLLRDKVRDLKGPAELQLEFRMPDNGREQRKERKRQ